MDCSCAARPVRTGGVRLHRHCRTGGVRPDRASQRPHRRRPKVDGAADGAAPQDRTRALGRRRARPDAHRRAQGAGADARADRLHRGDVDGRDRRRPLRERHVARPRCRSSSPASAGRRSSPTVRRGRTSGCKRKEEEAAFPLAFEIGYRDGKFRAFKGALSGSNLELFLHELTRNVDSISDFDKLPIPYRAIATNMVNGQQVVFYQGRLFQAMRASMSVPGMFAPVELDGKVLGDGGLVNNLPVDVVRAMGADIVIAVNIGTPLMSRDQLSSVVGYASQMVNILTEQNVRAQLAQLRPQDILISPDLGDLTFIDFAEGPEVRRTRHQGRRGGADQAGGAVPVGAAVRPLRGPAARHARGRCPRRSTSSPWKVRATAIRRCSRTRWRRSRGSRSRCRCWKRT